MRQINIHEAKTSLSEPIVAAERGEEVVVARANHPVVRLVSISLPAKKRTLRGFEGKVWVAPDLNAPLDDFVKYP